MPLYIIKMNIFSKQYNEQWSSQMVPPHPFMLMDTCTIKL